MGEDELANVPIQGEAVHAIACGQHHDGGRAVDAKAGANLIDAGLHEVFGGWCGNALGGAQNGENSTHGHVEVHIRGTIQGVKTN